MRELSESFMTALKEGGFLYPILRRVKDDHTLMLTIREGYINIYYRGGNILRLKEQSKGSYQPFFDSKYNKFGKSIPDSPKVIRSLIDATLWVDAITHLKEIMDLSFSINIKAEREFQQLVARENNYSTISNESEYFVSDIEFADSGLGARFDIMAIRWLASQRKNGANCRAAFIEMKYGDGALGGKSGILKHLQDFDALISDNYKYNTLLQTIGKQFNQLDELGLLSFNRRSNGTTIKLDVKDNPEVIFILANHNPRSTKLKAILNSHDVIEYGQSERFNLRFFVSSFAGYGLHYDCMVPLTQYPRWKKDRQ